MKAMNDNKNKNLDSRALRYGIPRIDRSVGSVEKLWICFIPAVLLLHLLFRPPSSSSIIFCQWKEGRKEGMTTFELFRGENSKMGKWIFESPESFYGNNYRNCKVKDFFKKGSSSNKGPIINCNNCKENY
jgi:hypothetical protein